MNTATKLGAYALGLTVVFGGAAGIGKIAGPVGAAADTDGHGGHNGGQSGAATTATTGTPAVPGEIGRAHV